MIDLIHFMSTLIDIRLREKYSTTVLLDRANIQRAFGQILATKRREAKLSQEGFGKLVGLSRTSITNIERGRQAIQLYQVYEFASILRVQIIEMLPMPTQQVQSRASESTLTNLETHSYIERVKQLPGFSRTPSGTTKKTRRR